VTQSPSSQLIFRLIRDSLETVLSRTVVTVSLSTAPGPSSRLSRQRFYSHCHPWSVGTSPTCQMSKCWRKSGVLSKDHTRYGPQFGKLPQKSGDSAALLLPQVFWPFFQPVFNHYGLSNLIIPLSCFFISTPSFWFSVYVLCFFHHYFLSAAIAHLHQGVAIPFLLLYVWSYLCIPRIIIILHFPYPHPWFKPFVTSV